MRKFVKAAAALTAGCMLLSTTAFAALEANVTGLTDGKLTLTEDGTYNVTISGITAGEESTIMVVYGDVDAVPTIGEDATATIDYIDQKTADDGTATYTIKPRNAAEGTKFSLFAASSSVAASTPLAKMEIPVSKVNVNGVTITGYTEALEIGGTVTLVATVDPEAATDKTVVWSSNATGVATVDAATGVVTAVAAGEAVITATATNGTEDTADDKTATVTVVVNAAAPALPTTAAIAVRNADPYGMTGYAVVKVTGIDAGSVAIKDADGTEVPAYLADYTADGGIRQYLAIVKGTEFTTDSIVWNAAGASDALVFGNIDGEGVVTVPDAAKILNLSVGILNFESSDDCLVSDVDGDGAVTVPDAAMTLNVSVGILTIPTAAN